MELPYVEELISSRTVSLSVELLSPLQVKREKRSEQGRRGGEKTREGEGEETRREEKRREEKRRKEKTREEKSRAENREQRRE